MCTVHARVHVHILHVHSALLRRVWSVVTAAVPRGGGLQGCVQTRSWQPAHGSRAPACSQRCRRGSAAAIHSQAAKDRRSMDAAGADLLVLLASTSARPSCWRPVDGPRAALPRAAQETGRRAVIKDAAARRLWSFEGAASRSGAWTSSAAALSLPLGLGAHN